MDIETVSVVIPSIGRPSLQKSVASAKVQIHHNVEIIVIDDSADQKIAISEVKVIKTGGNKGVSFSRNLGFKYSSSEFIAFLDDDDTWEPNHLLLNLDYLKKLSLDFVISSANVNGAIRPKKTLPNNSNPFEELYGKVHLFKSPSYLPTSGYLVSKKIFSYIRFNEDLIDRENLRFIYECYTSGYGIGQSGFATISINYNSKNSLKRYAPDVEIDFYNFLSKIDPLYAKNFKIESIRNLIRTGKYQKLPKILKEMQRKISSP